MRSEVRRPAGKMHQKAEVICYEDLGAEAVRRLEVENLPAVVVIDSKGNNLYEEGRKNYLLCGEIDMFTDFKLDPDYSGPIYKQIAETIQRAIRDGSLKPGTKRRLCGICLKQPARACRNG